MNCEPVVASADCEDYPPRSALNDLLFCERRCFLHRVEGAWSDNVDTVAATRDHRRAHASRDEYLADTRISRGLWVVSHALRLIGICDVVEFHDGIPRPVEYKRGRRRRWDNNEVQLCAQAMALEEMLKLSISTGAIYFVKSRRRQDVVFDERLRTKTIDATKRLHEVLELMDTPPPISHSKCQQCSLCATCLPELVGNHHGYRRSMAELFRTE